MFCTLHTLHKLACARQAIVVAAAFAFVHTLHKLPCASNGNFLHKRRVQGILALFHTQRVRRILSKATEELSGLDALPVDRIPVTFKKSHT
jgi:hypothetical protein